MAEKCAHCGKPFDPNWKPPRPCEICEGPLCEMCAWWVADRGERGCPTRGWKERPSEPEQFYWLTHLWGDRVEEPELVYVASISGEDVPMAYGHTGFAVEYREFWAERYEVSASQESRWHGPIEPPELPEVSDDG